MVSASRLRALGDIGPETKTTVVRLGDVEFVAALALHRWPNGGSWSLFIAPCCEHKVRTLRAAAARSRVTLHVWWRDGRLTAAVVLNHNI